jgi:hypothetical protein
MVRVFVETKKMMIVVHLLTFFFFVVVFMQATKGRSTVDPEEIYVKQERIGKGSFGEVYKG